MKALRTVHVHDDLLIRIREDEGELFKFINDGVRFWENKLRRDLGVKVDVEVIVSKAKRSFVQHLDDIRANPKAYFAKCVHREIANHFRGPGRRRNFKFLALSELVVAPCAEPDVARSCCDWHSALTKALQSLNPFHQEIIHLRFYGGLTFRKVARILDRPGGTVRAELSRAITRLRRHPALQEFSEDNS